MKRIFVIALILAVLVGMALVLDFYWKNLRGIGPAIQKPSEDISKLINTTPSAGSTSSLRASSGPLKLPDGFSVSIFAKDLVNPRVLSYDPAGNLIVSITSEGRVVALPDKNGDGVADEIITVIDGLNRPHGLATRCTEKCELYIAETNQVAIYDYDVQNLKAVNKRKIIDLPGGGNHFTRTILFMPAPNDHKLLTSVGSSCNVCNESYNWRAKILISNADGGDLKEFARGLRNTVFMAIHPVTGEIWGTEMGRDLLGDNLPPDEINIIQNSIPNFGWPTCYGKNIHDTNFDKNTYIRNPCMKPFETPSYLDIPAHSAPLGLTFIPEEGWPQEYWYNLLVAYHGSWNRSAPTGYKIVRYKLDAQGNYLDEEDFISGWLTENGEVLGRPVDILIQPGGIIYVSDDKAGVIYRVVYNWQEKSARLEDKTDLIRVSSPKENDVIKSPIVISGEARGYWFFEADFPARLLDGNGKEIAISIARAQSNWMTEDFVSFLTEIKFEAPKTESGTLVLQKDNPSGLPEHADEVRIPIRF